MAATTVLIHELDQKLTFLAHALADLGTIDRPSIRCLCDKANVNHSTIKSSMKSWRIGRLSAARFAELGSFAVDDDSWLDIGITDHQRRSRATDGYPGKDRAEAFQRKVRTGLGLNASVKHKLAPDQPEHLDSNLITLDFTGEGQAVDAGEGIRLFASIVGYPDLDPSGVRFGLKKVRLRLRLTDQLHTKAMLGRPEVTLRNALLRVEGGERTAAWTLHAPVGIIEGEYATTEDPICLVLGAEVGSVFHAEVAVQTLDAGSIATEYDAPLSSEASAVLKQLFEKTLPGVTDSRGWRTLGVQALRVVRA